ncbi:MAG: hypothetical protein GY938_22160 [Ketobacter sp.]|nr:hypothetical protein [Ketobacter sp.]
MGHHRHHVRKGGIRVKADMIEPIKGPVVVGDGTRSVASAWNVARKVGGPAKHHRSECLGAGEHWSAEVVALLVAKFAMPKDRILVDIIIL